MGKSDENLFNSIASHSEAVKARKEQLDELQTKKSLENLDQLNHKIEHDNANRQAHIQSQVDKSHHHNHDQVKAHQAHHELNDKIEQSKKKLEQKEHQLKEDLAVDRRLDNINAVKEKQAGLQHHGRP